MDSKGRFLLTIVVFTLARFVMVLVSIGSSGRGLADLFYPSWGSSAFYDALLAAAGYGSSTVAYWTIMPSFPSLLHLILMPLLGFGKANIIQVFRSAWVIAVIVSWVLATFAVPLFQSIAEKVMSRVEAMNCTLIVFFFPEIFVFSSLGFSSAFFLLLELAAWILLTNKAYVGWVVAACLFSLTELCGVAISIMLAAEMISLRVSRKVIYSFVPVVAFLMWLGYVQAASGNWMNVFGLGPYLLEYFSALLGFTEMSIASGQVYFDPIISSAVLCFLMIVGFLAFRVYRFNCVMGTYAISMVVACAVLVPAGALPRLLSLIFPVWLNLRIRSTLLTLALLFFFFLMSLLLWNGLIVGYLG
jgi:hypothetical protein